MDSIVLVGHGDLPRALKGSVGMIAGGEERLHTVCLAPSDGPDDLARKLEALDAELAGCERVLVLADLMGGSPANAALARYADDDRVSVVSGANLPMVLQAVMDGGTPAELVAAGRAGVRDVKAFMRGEKDQAPATAPAPALAPTDRGPKEIVGVRVDARGIHGQVATAWVPRLDVSRIVVVDDVAVRDETQKMALKMAKPSSVKLSILTAARAAERLADPESYPGERVFVVLTRVSTLGQLDELGYNFETVNMGNVPNRPNTTAFANTVHLSDEEAALVRALAEKGTRFTQRQVPSDPENDFARALATASANR